METIDATELERPYAPPEARAEPTASEKARAAERLLLFVLAAVQFANIMDFMIVMPLGPRLMSSLGIAANQFGNVVSFYTYSASIAGLLAALVIDRFDRRTALLFLVTGFTIGTFSCGLAGTYPLLLAARVATGAFGGVLGALVFAIIGDAFPESRRGAATGIITSAFAVASVFGVPFGLYLGTRYGWPAPFFLLGGIGVVVGLVAFVSMPSLKGHLEKTRDRDPLGELLGLLTHPNHLRAFALMVAIMFSSFAVVPYIAASMEANVGITKHDMMWLYVMGGACALVSSPIIGRLADRFGKLRVYWIMAVLSIVPIVAITNLPRVPLIVAMTAVSGLMVCNSGRMVPAVAMITSSVEPSRRGRFMSVNAAIQHLSAGLAAQVAATILGSEDHVTASGFRTVGFLAVAATLASLPLAARLRAAKPPALAEVAVDPLV